MNTELRELLVDFYVEQYRECVRRMNKKNVRTAHYMHRLNTKAKSIAKARYTRNERTAVNMLHQDVKRLAVLAYSVGNKQAKNILNRDIIPHLVRVDFMLMDDEECALIDKAYLRELAKDNAGAI